MNNSTILSPSKANSLFWLGRYTERVYLELHLLRLCFDKMIDGDPDDYGRYLSAIGGVSMYPDQASIINGLVHDVSNPASVISSVERCNDNAVLLRDEIKSPTLGYIQMPLELLRQNAKNGIEPNVDELQTLTDWMLAFWGSIEERVYDDRVRTLLKIGKLIEHIDMNVRFGYKFYRIEEAFSSLLACRTSEPRAFNAAAMDELAEMLSEEKYTSGDSEYKNRLLYLLGNAVVL
ncbi:MAG: alpha-E domain-containing protein [Bacteroidales bacterium]|nr:alpha-E domain-containing protein [Bacteroidales bacterium]